MTSAVRTAEVAVGQRGRFSLWIPWSLLGLLGLPIVVLLAPAVFVGFLILGADPFSALEAYWQVYSGLRGTRVVVECPGISIRIS